MRRTMLALIALLTVALPASAQDSLKVEFPGGELVIPIAGAVLVLQLPPIEVQDTTQLPDVVLPGDTVQLPDVIIPGDTTQLPDVIVQDTFPSGDPPVCRDGWVCTELPPEPDPDPIPTSPPLSISGLTLTMIGDSLHVSWNNRPNPDRGGVPVDGYVVRGGMNSSADTLPQLRVNSSPAGWTLTDYGSIWVCAYPFNGAGDPEQACGSVVYSAPSVVLDSQIEACFAVMRDSMMGIYYSPAADSCVRLGSMVDRDEVNRIHAAYWRARGEMVNDDPFPGTVTDLAIDTP